MPHNVEVSVRGDEIWGHIVVDGDLCGRGMIVRERLDEEDALQVVSILREAMTPEKVRSCRKQWGYHDAA